MHIREDYWESMDQLADHPAMFAGTPEIAHGMMVTLAALSVMEATGKPFGIALKQIDILVTRIMCQVPHSSVQIPLLCDLSCFPNHVVSFDAFSTNSKNLIALLAEV
jgi:hypothetical protein